MTLSTSAVAVCCCSDFAQLVEQARVLDGDDGLGGEVLDQLDLLVGERPHLLAVDGDGADQLVLLEHRHDEQRARARGDRQRDERGWRRDRRLPPDVGECGPPAWSTVTRPSGMLRVRWDRRAERASKSSESACGVPCMRPHGKRPALAAAIAELGLADARRVLQHGLEHRLQLAGRAEMTCSTSEVAVCCSSASESSRVRACTSSNSRTFSIAITAWSAKVVTSSICLSVNGRHRARSIK